jgi:polyketide synthase 13
VQLVIFAIQIALGELLKHHGAKPSAVVGQSLGEAAAAYFAGGLSLADATRTICARSHLMGEGEAMLFGEYIRLMALVEYSADEIAEVFPDFPGLEVCVYAAPSQTVIGGPPAQVDAIIERCESQGRFARKFATKGASHTTQMDPLLGELAAELQGIEAKPLKIGYFSTVHEAATSVPASRSTTSTTGARDCGTASSSPTPFATLWTTVTPPSWNWLPIRWPSCKSA